MNYMVLYPLEFLATEFQHRWQKYFISREWPKPETVHEESVAPLQDLAKPAGQEIRLSWIYWVIELTLLIRSQFSLRLNCCEMLWLYVDKSRLQGIPQSFYSNYPKNS